MNTLEAAEKAFNELKSLGMQFHASDEMIALFKVLDAKFEGIARTQTEIFRRLGRLEGHDE